METNSLENKKPTQEELHLEIGIADTDDWEDFKKIYLESYKRKEDREMLNNTKLDEFLDNKKFKSMWENEVSDFGDNFTVLIWNGSEVIGMGSAEKTGEKWGLYSDFIKPEFRNKGIGKKKIATSLAEIIRRGGGLVTATIKANNAPQFEILNKFGFKITKVHGDMWDLELDLSKGEAVKKINEILPIDVEVAKPIDWKVYKEIILEAMRGDDADMFGMTPDKLEMLEKRSDEAWQHMLSNEKEMFAVLARSEGEAVGTINAKNEGEDWYMGSLYVNEDFRRRKVGEKLFAECLKKIRERGGTKVTVGIKAKNEKSINLVTPFNFIKDEEHSTEEGYLMALEDVNSAEVIKKINEVLDAG